MSMDPPKVMLERSFLRAVQDPAHAGHAVSVAVYTDRLAGALGFGVKTLVDLCERFRDPLA